MIMSCAFLVASTFILLLLYIASLFISEFVLLDREEMSSYECGFEHHSLSRLPLSLRYYFLTMIFLVFDMEIMFLLYLPYTLVGVYSCTWGMIISLFFVSLLFLGLIYEWVDGSLDWVM